MMRTELPVRPSDRYAGPSQAERFQIYTDRPAHFRMLPDGHIDFDEPCNVLVHRTTSQLSLPLAECRLSLRYVFQGKRRFVTRDGNYEVDRDNFLLLKPGQTVQSHLASEGAVECLNLTFRPGFADEVARSLTMSEAKLLDNPQDTMRDTSAGMTRFVEKLYRHDDQLSPLVTNLRQALMKEHATSGWLEDQFHLALTRLLALQGRIQREIENVPAAKASTRIEVYKRLEVAREFMEDNLGRTLSLPEIAEAACISPHHFLRVFRRTYRETPHQYLTRKRLEKARRLLTTTEMTVSDICLAVGFSSVGTFSWLFKQKCGASPLQFRAWGDAEK